MNEKIIMIFQHKSEAAIDIEVPANITANELIYGLNNAYKLGINMDSPSECYLRTENPIALIRGDETLEEYGLRNGTIVYYDR